MASSVGSARRKRTQLHTSEPASSPATDHDPSPAVKRRRLNGFPASSPSTPKGFAAIKSVIGSALGIGRRGNAKPTHPSLAEQGKIGSSDNENAIEARIRQSRPAIKYKQFGIRPPKGRDATNSIYEVPTSDDELELPVTSRQEESTKENDILVVAVKKLSPIKKTTTTRRRSATRIEPDTPHDEEGERRSSIRTRRERNAKPNVAEISESEQDKRHSTPRRSKTKAQHGGQWKDISASKSAPAIKGILTPQHRKVGRPRKSVAFDNTEDLHNGEVYFEDLPSTAKSSAQRAVATKSAGSKPSASGADEEHENDEDEDESDEEVCVICSKPDSKPPNEIIFCDNCNKAVHQKCYNVPTIPEDDWFCRECLQEDAVPETDTSSGVQPAATSETPDIPNFEQHLRMMQRVLLDRCSGRRRIKLRGQDEAYQKAYQLVEQTVLAGEGNSMMIIGARGCGKTTLVENIISELVVESKDSFHVVRLNGFIHTDDKLALKEIWRQLGKEMNLEDELVNQTSNYADTMASLLALLSHPSEITGTDEGLTSKSVVFVIDEFDLFAAHARQTLLYNLFDIAQARKAPIAVLGLTTRVDVVESLEKRVKSRFSHRYIHLSLPKSLPAYWEICKQGLSVDEEDMEREGFDTYLEGLDDFHQYWDQRIEKVYQTPEFQDELEYHFYASKSVSAFLTTCILPLSALSTSSLALRIPMLQPVSGLAAPDSKLHLLTALADLDLALLIAAARLDITAHTDTVNFAMVYDEYSSQMGKQRVQSASSGMLALGAGGRVWGRSVAVMAWERLVSLGFLIAAGIGGRSNAAHGGLEGKMWKLDVALDEIPTAVELPGFLQKWCTQI